MLLNLRCYIFVIGIIFFMGESKKAFPSVVVCVGLSIVSNLIICAAGGSIGGAIGSYFGLSKPSDREELIKEQGEQGKQDLAMEGNHHHPDSVNYTLLGAVGGAEILGTAGLGIVIPLAAWTGEVIYMPVSVVLGVASGGLMLMSVFQIEATRDQKNEKPTQSKEGDHYGKKL